MIRAFLNLADDTKPPGLSWVEYATAVCGLLVSVGLIIGGLMKLYNKGLERKIQDGVAEKLEEQTTALTKALMKATQPIHPESNGGFSLPDVAKGVQAVDTKLTDVLSDIGELRVQTAQNAAGLSELRRMQRESARDLNVRLDEATAQRDTIGDAAAKKADDIQEENYPEEKP